jgi:hypothetical protein
VVLARRHHNVPRSPRTFANAMPAMTTMPIQKPANKAQQRTSLHLRFSLGTSPHVLSVESVRRATTGVGTRPRNAGLAEQRARHQRQRPPSTSPPPSSTAAETPTTTTASDGRTALCGLCRAPTPPPTSRTRHGRKPPPSHSHRIAARYHAG